MRTPDVVTLEDAAAAAPLLARRHRDDRAREPLLPQRFEREEDARRLIEGVLAGEGGEGWLALRDGRPTAFLAALRRSDPVRGEHVWVPPEGMAGEHGEDLRDLYARAAAGWVEAGLTAHYAVAPAFDRALARAFVRLGFGEQQVHALREIGEPAPAPAGAPTIRRAEPGDEDAARRLAPLVSRHQRGSPTFAATPPGWDDELAAGFAEAVGDPDLAFWLAERDGEAVGFAVLHAAAPGPLVPDAAVELASVATVPGERGRGSGRALVAHALAAAHADGARVCVLDWRAANLEASRFWEASGFRPTAYRLHRTVGGG